MTLPAADAIETIITFRQRLALSRGLVSLDFAGQALLAACRSNRDVRLVPADATPIQPTSTSVYVDAFGRLHVALPGKELPRYSRTVAFFLVGRVDLTPRAHAQLLERVTELETNESRFRVRADACLLRCTPAELREHALVVDDAVRHVEAVCLYIDDELYSLMEGSKTLLSRNTEAGGLFASLAARELVDWSPAERLAVATLRALYYSGRSIRFEEFNGAWVTAEALFARLQGLLESYGGHLDDLGPEPDLFELARAVGERSQTCCSPCLNRTRLRGRIRCQTNSLNSNPCDQVGGVGTPPSRNGHYSTMRLSLAARFPKRRGDIA